MSNLRQPSFTLIELLLTISIISILMTLLLPALKSARDRSYSINCQSRLKQIMQAELFYANDYDGNIAMCWSTSPGAIISWQHFITGGAGGNEFDNYIQNSSIMACPSEEPREFSTANYWNCYGGTRQNDAFPTKAGWNHEKIIFRVDKASNNTILFGDTLKCNDTTRIQRFFFRHGDVWDDTALHARHLNAVNGAFVDGHAESMKQPELYDKGIRNIYTKAGVLHSF